VPDDAGPWHAPCWLAGRNVTETPVFAREHFAQASPPAPDGSPGRGPAPPSGPSAGTAAGTRRPRILVVDDEEGITEMLSDYLKVEQYDVATAQRGSEAIDRLTEIAPDAILLDVRMPGMDGIETLRRLRARDAQVPVLMITGNDDLTIAQQALSLGAFDHILKPIDLDYLGRAVAKMLGARTPGAATGGDASDRRPAAPVSTQELLYELALTVFRVARALPPDAQASLRAVLEQTALGFIQHSGSSEKAAGRGELLRSLHVIRTVLRFAKDLGDLDDETHRRLESRIVRARTSMGLA